MREAGGDFDIFMRQSWIIDANHGIAHSKVTVIDGEKVIGELASTRCAFGRIPRPLGFSARVSGWCGGRVGILSLSDANADASSKLHH